MKPEWGSRLCARAASCGSTMMRLPSGSVPPSGEAKRIAPERSEEHTSELQSLTNLVCRLLLEKKKRKSKEDKSSRRALWRDLRTTGRRACRVGRERRRRASALAGGRARRSAACGSRRLRPPGG